MYKIDSQEMFDSTVALLADEFEEMTVMMSERKLSERVADSVVASYTETDDDGYVVDDTAVFSGSTVSATHGECISPYDVFPYTTKTVLGDFAMMDTTSATATELLAREIREVWSDS